MREHASTRPLSHALTLLSAITVLAGTAHAQFPGTDENTRIGILGPDGEMQYLPSADEMALRAEQAASRDTDLSVFADYAQRRLELASLVTEIVYVDDDAPVGGDGTSWKAAHQSLQDALAEDYSDRLVEIRMAQGNYRPDRFEGVNTNDPEATFSPRYEDTENPTGIYRITGGYAGLGTTDPDHNDPEQFPTIITGDLLGNDGPDFTNYEDNALALFSAFNCELHGLVLEHAVQAAFANEAQGRFTISDCLIQKNIGTDRSGAVEARSSVSLLIIKRSTFFQNRSGLYGGGVNSGALNTALVSNRFLSNQGAHGGAVFVGFVSRDYAVLQNNYFSGNTVEGSTSSVGGAAAIYAFPVLSACNTVVFNRSEDGPGGGFGAYFSSWNSIQYTALNVYQSNMGHTGYGSHEQFPSLPITNIFPAVGPHSIRANFVQDWESSESNRPGTYANTLDSIRDNSGEEVLFVDLAGPDGIIGTLDDDATPRPDSPNIDRLVDLEGAELAMLDFADLNENGVVDEPLPFDLLGNPRSIDTPGIGEGGGIDAGAIEYAGDPNRFDYHRPISGRRVDPMDGCEGDEPIRLYVNASGPVSGDGSSWDSPLLELYEALDIARARCGPVEIWLAAGTYLPDFSVPLHRASFRPTSNAAILGGFAGWEQKADQRNPNENSTILSGDQFGNDLGDQIMSGKDGALKLMEDNAYRVVVSAGPRGGGVIDGVTITGGYPRARSYVGLVGIGEGCILGFGPYAVGAGVTHLSGDLRLINCTFSRSASRLGIAVALWGTGSLELRSVEVLDNQIRNSPCPADDSVSQIAAYGADSILARPAQLSIVGTRLFANDGTTPFRGWLSGNLEVSLDRSDIDFATPPSGIDSELLGPGQIDVREFLAESSLIRRCFQIIAADSSINNCSLAGNNFLTFRPVASPPAEQRLVLSNSVVFSMVAAEGALRDIAEAINSVYINTNFTHRRNEIRLFNVSQFGEFIVDPFGPSGDWRIPDGDYRLLPGSPAINTGLNAFVDSDFDLDGNPRIIGSVVDRGAYEFTGTCTGDVNGDGVIDLADLNRVLANYEQDTPFGDADGDGSVTMTDLNIVLAAFGNLCPEP